MTDTPPAAPPIGEQVQPQAASATEALYRAALAPGQVIHYLNAFARFDELGVARAHWNPAAGLTGWHWLLRRRLWREAVLHGLSCALAVAAWWWAQRLWGPWPDGMRWGLLAAIGVVAVVVPGWWGDAWLHASVRRRMTAAVRRARTVQEACALLLRPSPLRHVWWVVLALEIGALAWWRLGAPAPVPAAAPEPEPVLSERAPLLVPAVPVAIPEDDGVAREPARDDTRAEPPTAAAPVQSTPTEVPPVSVTPPHTPATTPTAESVAPPAAEAPRPRLGGHGVAVGIFADPANAQRAARRLSDAGLPVVSDPVESARGPLTRVRVGPFATHEEARDAAETVRNLGLEARIYGPR